MPGAGLDVAALARDAHSRADFDELGRLVTSYPLEFWFGVPPSEVHAVLAAVPRAELRRHPTAAALLRVLTSTPVAGDFGAGVAALEADGDPRRFRQGVALAEGAQARLTGDPVRAFTVMRGLHVVAQAVPQLIDPSRGERTFALVQTGISGMLAGRFPEALTFFEKSLVPPIPASLAFLTRDAHVRSAMIHALYGDPNRAQVHLAAAREVPRTGSWVEAILDSDERLVVTLLRPAEESRLAFESAAATTVGQMHELWPIHVAAISQLSLLADRRDEGRRRLQEISDAGLAQHPGSGFTGSILPIAVALDALASGAVGRAQQLLEGADRRLWLTKLLLALTAVTGGAHAKALRLARSISAQTRGLPQADAARVAVVALAQHGLGEDEVALAALGDVPPWAARFAAELLSRFSPGFVALVAERLPEWAPVQALSAAPVEFEERLLTDRELEMLAGLALGQTREEIARSLFLSVNTVKSHQRSLYRKLGATTASEAVLEGRRRGLI